MGTTPTTFTLDESLADQARRLGINISAAAREGVAAAVRDALAIAGRAAYERNSEQPDAVLIRGRGPGHGMNRGEIWQAQIGRSAGRCWS